MNADGTLRIMIINEENKCLETERKMLFDMIPRVEIICLNNPTDALKQALEESFDVIIMDVKMEQMHGMILAQKIFQKKRRTNIIFLADTEDYALDAIKMNISNYILKPVSKEQMKLSLENLRYPLIRYDQDGRSLSCLQ